MEKKIYTDDILLLELSSSVQLNKNPPTEWAVETEFTHLKSHPLIGVTQSSTRDGEVAGGRQIGDASRDVW